MEFIHISRLFRSKPIKNFPRIRSFPPPSRFSLNFSYFFFQGKKILSDGKIPRDTLLLRGKAVLYIVACQFLTFEDRSGLKLNFPANLLREREWFCNRVDIIVSCVTLHEKRKKIFFSPIIETRSKGKGRKKMEKKERSRSRAAGDSKVKVKNIPFSSPPPVHSPGRRINFCRPISNEPPRINHRESATIAPVATLIYMRARVLLESVDENAFHTYNGAR